ncbi:MAG: hypothetical protein U9N46_03605 [Euryarchaeota archaeon]|nr:MAG: hypothetical protein C5S47_01655 [ANME-2 cluster archaeon]MEA1864272.1 hypothetical protein [Euryarchaeota archaeon]
MRPTFRCPLARARKQREHVRAKHNRPQTSTRPDYIIIPSHTNYVQCATHHTSQSFKQFTSLKKKKDELARIIDKKKIYSVDVGLDQIMTCFKISFANICCYLLDECFNGEKMTLQRLFEVIFDLQGEVRIENGCRNIFIKRNPKQQDIMEKLDSALDSINHMGVEDLNGCTYNFKLV